jgi:hypothetical protein
MRPFSKAVRFAALATALTALAGCSEYLDRRDSISLNGGDAVASNKVAQMVDPWPRVSANRNFSFNGDVMESAYARYRTNRVIPPVGTGTSTTYQATATPSAAAVPQSVTAPAAPVK